MMRSLLVIGVLLEVSLVSIDAFKVPVPVARAPVESAVKSPLFRGPTVDSCHCNMTAKRPSSRLAGIKKHVMALTVGAIIWRGAHVPEAHAARTRESSPPTTSMTKLTKTLLPAAGTVAIVTGTGVVLGHKRSQEEQDDYLGIQADDSVFVADVQKEKISDVVDERLRRLEIEKLQAKKILERIEARSMAKTNVRDKNHFKMEAEIETQKIFEAIRLEREEKMNAADPKHSPRGSFTSSLSSNSRKASDVSYSSVSNKRPIVMNGYSQSLAAPTKKSVKEASAEANYEDASIAKTRLSEQSRPNMVHRTPSSKVNEIKCNEKPDSLTKPNEQPSAKAKMYIVSERKSSDPVGSSKAIDATPHLPASDSHQKSIVEEDGDDPAPLSRPDGSSKASTSSYEKPDTFAGSKFLPLIRKPTNKKTEPESERGPTVKEMAQMKRKVTVEDEAREMETVATVPTTTSMKPMKSGNDNATMAAIKMPIEATSRMNTTARNASVTIAAVSNAASTTPEQHSLASHVEPNDAKKSSPFNETSSEKAVVELTESSKTSTPQAVSLHNEDISKNQVSTAASGSAAEKLNAGSSIRKLDDTVSEVRGGDTNSKIDTKGPLPEEVIAVKHLPLLNATVADAGNDSDGCASDTEFRTSKETNLDVTVTGPNGASATGKGRASTKKKHATISKLKQKRRASTSPHGSKENKSKHSYRKKKIVAMEVLESGSRFAKSKRVKGKNLGVSKPKKLVVPSNRKGSPREKSSNSKAAVNEDKSSFTRKGKGAQSVVTSKALNEDKSPTSIKRGKVTESQELKIKSALAVAKATVLEAGKQDNDSTVTSFINKTVSDGTTKVNDDSNGEKRDLSATKRDSGNEDNGTTKLLKAKTAAGRKFLELYYASFSLTTGTELATDKTQDSTKTKLKVVNGDKLWKPTTIAAPLQEAKPIASSKRTSSRSKYFMDVVQPTKAETSFTATRMTTGARGLHLDESTMETLGKKKDSSSFKEAAIAAVDDLVMKSVTEGPKLLIRGVLWIHQGISNHVSGGESDRDQ